jgi:hypothetical protein
VMNLSRVDKCETRAGGRSKFISLDIACYIYMCWVCLLFRSAVTVLRSYLIIWCFMYAVLCLG